MRRVKILATLTHRSTRVLHSVAVVIEQVTTVQPRQKNRKQPTVNHNLWNPTIHNKRSAKKAKVPIWMKVWQSWPLTPLLVACHWPRRTEEWAKGKSRQNRSFLSLESFAAILSRAVFATGMFHKNMVSEPLQKELWEDIWILHSMYEKARRWKILFFFKPLKIWFVNIHTQNTTHLERYDL